jgi:hypothetical protein
MMQSLPRPHGVDGLILIGVTWLWCVPIGSLPRPRMLFNSVIVVLLPSPLPHVNGTCSGDEAFVCVCSLTALKALVNIMIVGRAAKEIVARERKDLFERLIRAQVRIISDQLFFGGPAR